jgi:hypothetical protein
VAVYCWVAPAVRKASTGATVIDCSVGATTVSVVEPETEPRVAMIVVVPVATVLARPPALMVAALVLLELQVTELVMFCVVPLL